MGTLAYRAMGAAVLDASTYESVEGERLATRQAFLVVLVSSLAAGVGGGSWAGPHVATLAAVAGVALLTWLTWAALRRAIGVCAVTLAVVLSSVVAVVLAFGVTVR